ncbi:hypothetical protein ACIRNI_25400 [Streptomyces sp. NPDC093546]|uniref:hypothetical protein n=1 Tax=Streptomyces sp. NPDC093546 TaxID=3366040 RepID=UPI00381735D6
MTGTTPSRFLRLVLRADAFTTSTPGTITLIVALLTLLFTDTAAGLGAAAVLFAAWVAVGWTGRRYERLSGRSRAAGDR